MPDSYHDFVRLFVVHEARLRGFLRSLLPTWDDVDEVLQETSLIAWKKFPEFETGSNFMAWICTIARFKVIHHLRAKARDHLVFDESVIELIAQEADDETTQREREHRALRHCLDKLPPQQANLLQQAYQPGIKFHQAAELSGKSVDAYYKILQRLRSLLQDCIQRQLKEPTP